MRLERDVNSSQREVAELADSEQPPTFQGLVLEASGARALGSEKWQSELERAGGGVEYRLDRRQSRQTPPSAFSGEDQTFLSGEQSERNEDESRSLRPRMQILLSPINEEKPPSTRALSARPLVTRSRTRNQSTRPQMPIDVPADRVSEQQRNEDQDEEKKAEDPSPPASSTGEKKARKRPHYLSHEDRCQIIERIAGGEQQAALAREFGVTRAAVCHIQKHRFEILARPVAQPGEVATATGLARDQQLIIEVRTPSVLLLLTKLRDRSSDAATFRRATGRIIMILIEEVLGLVDARAVQVTTSSGHTVQGIERRHEICGVKLGDEGYPFSVLFHQVEVDAAEGYIQVDSEVDPRGRRQWRLERMDLPASIASCTVLLFTATFSTGERECKAIEALVGLGVPERNISLLAIVCASDGVVAICSRFPQLRIVTAAIDSAVDPLTEDIVPGLGDFIARYNGEYVHATLKL